jgi:porphobilinogen synthase
VFPEERPRRLRRTPALRRMVAETSLEPHQFVLPMFVKEGATEPIPITSMPGVFQHTRESLRKAVVKALEAGIGGVMPFGIPAEYDADGSGGLDPDGVLNAALRDVRAEVSDGTVIMSDLCIDEFTDHGHCGVLDEDGQVDNDRTLRIYGEMAVAQIEAGAHVVGSSGMMDGQVAATRAALDRRVIPRVLCSPTRSSTRPLSLDRSAKPWTRSSSATARPTSRIRPMDEKLCGRSGWT